MTTQRENSKTTSNGRLAMVGSLSSVIAFGSSQVIRLGSNLVLTHILFPEVFGIMAIIQVVLQALMMMSDIGISTSVIRDDRGDDRDYLNTAWTLQIIRGFFIWGFCCALAYPAAMIYDAPELFYLIPVITFSAVFQGFTSPVILSLKRHIRLNPLFIWQVATQLLTTIITIAAAWYFRSIWAIALGGLVGAGLTCLLSYFFTAQHKVSLRLDPSAVSNIFGFGKWIFVSSFITFLINKGDVLVLGVFLTKADLGVFAIASIWSQVVFELMQKINQQVMTPLYAMIYRERGSDVIAQIRKTRVRLLTFSLPIIWAVIYFAQLLIDTFYDERYVNAGWMIQVLGIGTIARMVTASSANALLSFGDSYGYMVFQVSAGILLVVCMLVGGTYFGTVGLIAGVSVSKFVSYPLLAIHLKKHGVWLPGVDASAIGASIVVLLLIGSLNY